MKFILIDGYNKSLFYNVLKLYLKQKKNYKNYDMIDIDDYVYYEYIFKKNHLADKIIIENKFMEKMSFYINENNHNFDLIFIFNTSNIIRDKIFKPQNDNYEIKLDFVSYFFFENQKNFDDIEFFFLDNKLENYIKMNQFLCTIRFNNIHSFHSTFMPFGGYIFFNYFECIKTKEFYNSNIYNNLNYQKENFISLFQKILRELEAEYDFNLLDNIVKSYTRRSHLYWFLIFFIILIIHIVFYLPYYIFFIHKIKNKEIKFKNKLYLLTLLLLPISTFIIPSYGMLFVPEIINIMCFIKLLKGV